MIRKKWFLVFTFFVVILSCENGVTETQFKNSLREVKISYDTIRMFETIKNYGNRIHLYTEKKRLYIFPWPKNQGAQDDPINLNNRMCFINLKNKKFVCTKKKEVTDSIYEKFLNIHNDSLLFYDNNWQVVLRRKYRDKSILIFYDHRFVEVYSTKLDYFFANVFKSSNGFIISNSEPLNEKKTSILFIEHLGSHQLVLAKKIILNDINLLGIQTVNQTDYYFIDDGERSCYGSIINYDLQEMVSFPFRVTQSLVVDSNFIILLNMKANSKGYVDCFLGFTLWKGKSFEILSTPSSLR